MRVSSSVNHAVEPSKQEHGPLSGDRIVAVDEISVDSVDGLQRTLDASRIDKPVKITALRGAQKIDLMVTPVEQTG